MEKCKFYVADFKLTDGKINNACVWNEDKGINLEEYKDNPLDLIDVSHSLHVQNRYTSLIIRTDEIINISIREISDEEW